MWAMISGTGRTGAHMSMTGVGIYASRSAFMRAISAAVSRASQSRKSGSTTQASGGRSETASRWRTHVPSAVSWPTITALLALGARDVLAGLRVDPDRVPLADEVRHLHHQAGLGGGGLEGVGDGRALQPGGGLDDLQVDRLRQAHAHRLPIVELDLDAGVGD